MTEAMSYEAGRCEVCGNSNPSDHEVTVRNLEPGHWGGEDGWVFELCNRHLTTMTSGLYSELDTRESG